MLILLTTLLGTLSSMLCSRAMLELENLALRHQVGVRQRSARKRPRLTPADRLLWVGLSRLWRDWRSALAIVKPETVPTENSSKVSSTSQVTMLHALVLLKPQINFDTDVADSLAPRLR
jgi:hypothetical protein